MVIASIVLTWLYYGLLVILTVYGFHRTWLLYVLGSRIRPSETARTETAPAETAITGTAPLLAGSTPDVPSVTIQLPIYNERYVVERLIRAVVAIDYPSERLEIQVLDDSTDETSVLIDQLVALYRGRGINIVHLRRAARTGFKAGALEAGLSVARGELIAVFDADFVPRPDFLLRCTRSFQAPDVGMVQARWGHLNAHYSALTSAQAALLDGHFLIEHAARYAAGCFFNFNGTAGVWRRECIARSGGWQHDTLTEDLDLSYRAQLAGWRFVYLPDVVAPAELPVQMSDFKSQQRRWAKGSTQTALKLLPTVLRSQCSSAIKREAFFHLTANLSYLWIFVLALLLPVMALVRPEVESGALLLLDVLLFGMSLISVTGFYGVAQRELETTLLARLKRVPVIMALGTGMAINNGLAVLEAIFGVQSPFVRTPKHGIEHRSDQPAGYWKPPGLLPILEVGMGVYLLGGLLYALAVGRWGAVPFMVIFMAGFLFVGLGSHVQGRRLSPQLTRGQPDESVTITGSESNYPSRIR